MTGETVTSEKEELQLLKTRSADSHCSGEEHQQKLEERMRRGIEEEPQRMKTGSQNRLCKGGNPPTGSGWICPRIAKDG